MVQVSCTMASKVYVIVTLSFLEETAITSFQGVQ